jgi:hypothetical protein
MMPVFQIESDGKRFEVDAPDMQTAAASLDAHSKSSSKNGGGKSFMDHLKSAWDQATPGGPLWIAKQAVEGITGAVDASKAATSTPQTEEEAFQQNQGRERGPGFAMQAASVMAPGAPKGTGGVMAAPMQAAGAVRSNLPSVITSPRSPMRPTAPSGGEQVVQAADRLSAATGTDIPVPRAISSDSTTVQRIGQGVRNIPVVGDPIPKATDRLVQDVGGAVRNIADQYGHGSGANVAGRIGSRLGDEAEAEMAAATGAAQRSDDAVLAAHQRDTDAAQQNIAARERQSLEAARAAVGDMPPQDMGAALIERLRTHEATARTNKDALYAQAGQANAAVRADEVQNVRSVVAQGLENSGVVVDPLLTPAANRMMDELQRLAQLDIPNRAVGARVPAAGDETRSAVSVQGIEQTRKRLSFLRSAASNDADRRAVTNVMRNFDDWQSHAFETALLSGDDTALQAFRGARAANTAWRDRFFNDEDDAGGIITRIVTGEVTPQEVANYVVGAGQVGAKGVSSRLLTRIGEATNNDPEVEQAIRGGVWNRLTQATEGATAKAPAKVAGDISEFLNGSGRDVANRLLSPEQQRLARAYVQTLRTADDARALIGEVSAATMPGAMPVQSGPLKQIADAVIGKGRKSDEALFTAIDARAKSGSRGDISTLAKLIRVIPQEERSDLAGAIIRGLGVSPRTGQFSPDVFVSQWSTYTPQAKAILFGNAGAQRQALDDIAIISSRLKEVQSKFGNPSGTAQNAGFAGLATMGAAAATAAMHGDVVAPLTFLATVTGGYGVAKLLASPASASSLAKWAKAYANMISAPSPSKTALYKIASRNIASTAQTMGIKISPADLLRSIQGPVPAGAQDKKQ